MSANVPVIICPHCETANPPFGEQRCVNCRINMMSDGEYETLQQLQPKVETLEMHIRELEEGKLQKQHLTESQPLLDQLALYQDRFPFLASTLTAQTSRLSPFMQQYQTYRRTLRIHWLIWAILALFPFGALIIGAAIPGIILLGLPLIGWYLIGIRSYSLQRGWK